MAKITTYASTVPLSTEATPKEAIATSPEAFGAGVATAVQGLGETVATLGDKFQALALKHKEEDDQATKDQAAMQYEQAKTDMLYQGEHAFYNTEGKAAYDAYPETQQRLMLLRDNIAASLPNANVKKLFDNDTRRDAMLTTQNMAAHASKERKSWLKETDTAVIDNNVSKIGLARSDAEFAAGHQDLQNAVIQQGLHEGWDAETVTKEAAKATSKANSAYAMMMATRSKPDALDWVQKHATDNYFTPKDLYNLMNSLNTAARPEMASDAADGYMAGNIPPVSSEDFVSKYIIPVGEHGRPGQVSPKGALGTGQIIPGTAAFLAATDPQLKAAGFTFDPKNPADLARLQNDDAYNRAFAQANGRYLYKRYNGDPMLAAVAYVGGPGSADRYKNLYGTPSEVGYQKWVDSLPSATPNQIERKSYAQRILTSMGSSVDNTHANILADQTAMDEKVRKDYAGDPQLAHAIITELHARIHDKQNAITADQANAHDVVISKLFLSGPPMPLKDAMNDPTFMANWTKLPPAQQVALERQTDAAVQREQNLLTADKMERYRTLDFQSKTDPESFLKTDLIKEDLPNNLKLQLIRAQASIAGHKNPEADPNVNRILGNPHMKDAMMQGGLIDKATGKVTDRELYNKFGGQLYDMVDQYQQVHGKKMPLDEALKAANALFVKQPGWHWDFLGHQIGGSHAATMQLQKDITKIPSPIQGMPAQDYKEIQGALQERFPGRNIPPSLIYSTWQQAQK